MTDPLPPHAANSNLLLGLLALQDDLISKDAYVRAVQVWLTNPARPLGDILVADGALSAESRARLESRVVQHPAGPDTGGTPGGATGATTAPPHRAELTVDPAPDLPTTPPRSPGAWDVAGGPAHPVGKTGVPKSRFCVLRPHAQGGLGQVSVALDEELGREVALKEMQEPHADDPASRSRFVREAEVTGRLEHPGIVPVYGLGRHPDGRPFYAMRFIRGDSLKRAIKKFHQADAGRRDPGERALALRQLLGRFVTVCNAVAYAHSRGVLHRDLKADNVMLGEYGETLVVDWGLAKVLGRPEEAVSPAGKVMPAAEADDAAATRAGAILGTPAFMPPEQALGQAEKLGPASDVYSLGALLYQLLTGRAPFEDESALAILMRVAKGDFPPPRRVKTDVPAPLEAICLKAMALTPEDRYGAARALADDVEHWLADEPVSAWREPRRVRAGRWARRHKTAVGAAAAGVLVAVLAAGVGLWWWQQQRSEQRRAVQTALDEVTRLQEQARWAEARAVLAQAADRLGEDGPEDLEERLARARRGLDLVARLDAIRLKRATWVQDRFDRAGADRDYAAAFQEAGLGRVGDDPAQVARRVAATDVRGALVAALDEWAGSLPAGARQAWALAVARQADPDRVRDQLRDPKVWSDPAALARLTGRVPAGRLSPPMVAALGQQLRSRGEPLLRAGQERHPGDFWLNFHLANVLLADKKVPGEAVGYYRAALAVRPDASSAHNNLGVAFHDLGRLDEAAACFRRAIAFAPGYAGAHTGLGAILHRKGRLDEAIACCHRAIALDPRDAYAHNNLGNALRDKGRLDQAIAAYHKAITLDKNFAYAHNNLGRALKDKGRLGQAILEYQNAVAIDPKYTVAFTNLGLAFQAKKQLDEAITCYRRAVELDPGLAQTHTNLCLALMARGLPEDAITCCRRAIDIDPKNVAAHINLGRALLTTRRLDEGIACLRRAVALDPKHALAHTNLGLAFRMKGQPEQALAAYHKAIDSDPKYAQAQGARGRVLLTLGRFAEARQSLQRCGALLPAADPFQKWVGQQLHTCDQLLAQEARLARIVQGKEQPTDADERLRLAWLCARYKRLYATAARLYADALTARPKCADDLVAAHRSNAARAAALAGSGKGADAAQLDDRERARWRQQAVTWLRADLGLWARHLDSGQPDDRVLVRQKLLGWQKDLALAGIRDAAALDKLPEAERAACRKLWADVADLLKKTENSGKP